MLIDYIIGSIDFLTDLRGNLFSKLFGWRYKLSDIDRSEIYSILGEYLSDNTIDLGVALEKIARGCEIEKDKKNAKIYRSIGANYRNTNTQTPIADAFKPFIPKADYQSLRRAESKRMLADSLPHIQTESQVRSFISSNTRSVRVFWLTRVILPILVAYPFIDLMMPMFYPQYGENTFDPFYKFWHAVSEFSIYAAVVFIAGMLVYFLFYMRFRDTRANSFRRKMDVLPLFKGFKEIEACSALINTMIALNNARGISAPQTIADVATYSRKYTTAFIEQLASDSARLPLGEALCANPLFPNQLRSILSKRLAIAGSKKDLITPVRSAITSLTEKNKIKSAFWKKIAVGINYILLLTPPVAALVKGMQDLPSF